MDCFRKTYSSHFLLKLFQQNLIANHPASKAAFIAAAPGSVTELVRALSSPSALVQERSAAILGIIAATTPGASPAAAQTSEAQTSSSVDTTAASTTSGRDVVLAAGAMLHLARLSRSTVEGVKREAMRALARLRQ